MKRRRVILTGCNGINILQIEWDIHLLARVVKVVQILSGHGPKAFSTGYSPPSNIFTVGSCLKYSMIKLRPIVYKEYKRKESKRTVPVAPVNSTVLSSPPMVT